MEAMRTIDYIEKSKMEFFRDTGAHLGIKLYRNHIALTVTEKPIRPKMLPIAKIGKIRGAINRTKSVAIKVKNS